MDERCRRRRNRRPEEPISLQAEVEVVYDPELARRQVKAVKDFLLSYSTRVANPNSDAHVGDGSPSADGLERLVGPLQADVVRAVWAAQAPLSVRQALDKLNANRPAPLRYTTVQTVMVRLANKGVLARSRVGRGDRHSSVASDAASLAVSRVLAQFGETAIKPFVEQVHREPKFRSVLRSAMWLTR